MAAIPYDLINSIRIDEATIIQCAAPTQTERLV